MDLLLRLGFVNFQIAYLVVIVILSQGVELEAGHVTVIGAAGGEEEAVTVVGFRFNVTGFENEITGVLLSHFPSHSFKLRQRIYSSLFLNTVFRNLGMPSYYDSR